MMPPLITVGSKLAASSSVATSVVVVVLPCVPAIATAFLKRMISASISARRTTGRPRERAAASSGLPFLMAEEITTTAASPRLSPDCPTLTSMPMVRRRCTLALSALSEPCTL